MKIGTCGQFSLALKQNRKNITDRSEAKNIEFVAFEWFFQNLVNFGVNEDGSPMFFLTNQKPKSKLPLKLLR